MVLESFQQYDPHLIDHCGFDERLELSLVGGVQFLQLAEVVADGQECMAF